VQLPRVGTEAEKFTTFQFRANANCEQIYNLAQSKEVIYVTLPPKGKIVLPSRPPQELGDSPLLP